MADYCTKMDVYDRLPDIKAESANDTEIGGCISQAMLIVDDKLRPHVTVPLATTPSQILHATADIAAAIFRSRRAPDFKMPPLYDQALTRLDEYVKSTYKKGKLAR